MLSFAFKTSILTLSVPLSALAFGNEAHASFASCLCWRRCSRRLRSRALAFIPVGFALVAASAIVAPCIAAIGRFGNLWLRPRAAALERHECQQKRRRHQCIIHLYLYSVRLFKIEHSANTKKNNGTSPKARPGRHLCCST